LLIRQLLRKVRADPLLKRAVCHPPGATLERDERVFEELIFPACAAAGFFAELSDIGEIKCRSQDLI
jgi:hypothetical protein